MPRQYTPKVRCTCDHCGAEFERCPSNLSKSGMLFCSTECYRANRAQGTGRKGPTVEIACPICGVTFKTWPHRMGEGIPCCSVACGNEAKRRGQQQQCAVCGKPFYVVSSRLRSRYPVRFCSLRCRGKAQRRRNQDERNSPEYIAWRDAVCGRDGHTCRDCGATANLHAHHIKPFARFPQLRLVVSNGLTLCAACHGKRHGW